MYLPNVNEVIPVHDANPRSITLRTGIFEQFQLEFETENVSLCAKAPDGHVPAFDP